jgi:hypothetical protein
MRQGRILIATFHPELTSDITVHQYFLSLARQETATLSENEPLLGLAGSDKDPWSAERADK